MKRSRIRTVRIHQFMQISSVTTLLCCIGGAYAYMISPRAGALFAYLGLLFPYTFVLSIGFLIYWLIIRRWTCFFIGICALLICWKPIMRYVPFNPDPPETPRENVLKMLSYNVMGFAYKDHTADQPNPIISYIANSGADIVCLQEYMVGLPTGKALTETKIKQALEMYPYCHNLPLLITRYYTVGLGIFSKYPILRSWKVRYDSAFNGSVVYEIDVDGKHVFVVNNHLESFKLTMGDRTQYADLVSGANIESLDKFLGKFQLKLGSAFRIRGEQAEIVAHEVNALEGRYIIVCGDFNDTPVSYTYHTMRGWLGDAFEKSGNGPGITYNRNIFRYRIDHILYSPNIEAFDAVVDKSPFSDHYPVRCTLELK